MHFRQYYVEVCVFFLVGVVQVWLRASGFLVLWSRGLVLWSPGPLVPWSSGAWLRLLEGYKYCKLQSSVLQKARKSARYKYNICGVFHAKSTVN